uniref:Uncharacterized protein n=1 Tax=Salix viminalis TaxID=40686 RepID=A0A6N2NH17_SALVM
MARRYRERSRIHAKRTAQTLVNEQKLSSKQEIHQINCESRSFSAFVKKYYDQNRTVEFYDFLQVNTDSI